MAYVKGEKRNFDLSPELLEKARVELNEIQSEVPGHIEALRMRILEDPTINFRTDDAFLLRFLRARKFDQDKAFELITNYYRQREYYPTFFSKTKPELEKILEEEIVGVLPNRDANGRAVILTIFERWNTAEVSFEEMIYNCFVTLEGLIEDEAAQINGAVWIVDLANLNLSQVAQMSPWKIKEAISVCLHSFPLRLKNIHYVNESSIFDGVYLIIKPFLSKKLQDRIVFHGNVLASLHEHVSPEILPEDLDGDLEPVDFGDWNELMLKNFDKMVEDYEYGFVQLE